ncbi:MAG: hypothetical protein OEW99_02495 [Gammaproteobacteria bacterium]|nr:hypothetical protein [Gammaproteobacteria bacterium]
MNKDENINNKRVLLAGASIFIIMPIFLFLLEKIIGDSDTLSNPKLLLGIIFGGAVLTDHLFVKYLKNKNKIKNETNN